MDQQSFLKILDCTESAVLSVEDGKIVWCSNAARRMGIYDGMALEKLIKDNEIDPLKLPTTGRLTLHTYNAELYAQVCAVETGYMLILHDEAPTINEAAMAQASRMLRIPLSEVMHTSNKLFALLEEEEDEEIQAQTASIVRGYYRILRTASALSDLGMDLCGYDRIEMVNWFKDRTDVAEGLIRSLRRKLDVEFPTHLVYAKVDIGLIDHALASLLSNAIAYSPPESTIEMRFQHRSENCIFTVRNETRRPVDLSELSNGFSRLPEQGKEVHGLGLGLDRVQHIARQHGGTLLLEYAPTGRFVATLRIPCRLDPEYVRTPLRRVERTGGYDRLFIELSEVLPDDVYDTRCV